MEQKNEQKVTRVALYADLRDKIEKMDTLSFDDPNRDEKYGLNNKQPVMPIIHEQAMDEKELKESHIKKNTLSISIEDLIKQNDDYTIALEKEAIDKSFKEVKKKNSPYAGKGKIIIPVLIVLIIVLILIIVLCCVLLIK